MLGRTVVPGIRAGYLCGISGRLGSLYICRQCKSHTSASGKFELYAVPGGEDPEVYTRDEFPEKLREDDWSIYNEYNTSAAFEDGELVWIWRSGYPHGPDTGEEDDDDC